MSMNVCALPYSIVDLRLRKSHVTQVKYTQESLIARAYRPLKGEGACNHAPSKFISDCGL